MAHYEARDLPYTCEQLFDLAADVERYPDFLPGWTDASIVARDGDTLSVTQQIGFGPLQCQLLSKAVLTRPHRIQITSHSHPFQRVDIGWHFEAIPVKGSRITLAVDFSLHSKLLEGLLALQLDRTTRQLMILFERRARQIYLPATQTSPA